MSRTLMTGNNELHLNMATVKAIIQEWLDKEYNPTTGPAVASVSVGNNGLVVKLNEKEEDEKA